MKYRYSSILTLSILLSGTAPLTRADALTDIVGNIQKLEGQHEPKCFATASRLEDFMFGTPLTDKARFAKNELQTQWIEQVWKSASKVALKDKASEVSQHHVETALSSIYNYRQNDAGDWLIKFNNGQNLTINKNDKRQYSSIAYSLRAILAVQQQHIFDVSSHFLPLSEPAIKTLKIGLDVFALAALKSADQQARLNNEYELTESTLRQSWSGLFAGQHNQTSAQAKLPTAVATDTTTLKANDLKLLKAVIAQKVASYETYNQINNQLFVRNLQVFFARNRWPKDAKIGAQFKSQFTETLIAFAADLYKGAESIAIKNGHAFIKDVDVNTFAHSFIPHQINDYEDALFFPALPVAQRVEIESYDMDAFRDSGIHWRYLQYAINAPEFKAYLEPDPFASELIVENVAQFGVLVLRMTGIIGRSLGEERIALSHFDQALKEIQQRINQHAVVFKQQAGAKPQTVLSATTQSKKVTDKSYFTDVSASSGIDFTHRSSDWLNRLLRSYLKKDASTGIITIPPAFGGAGVAAEDINNDGLPDVLILSGLGNKLYANRGDGRFEDITAKAGLDWKRESDHLAGEPRQPIIADFDNDGRQDVLITYVDDTHRLYRNLGNEKFEDVTLTAKLGGKDLVGGPATVFDFDNDGLLDVYITYFGDYLHGVLPTLKRRNSNGLPNRLFKNLGHFKFKDVTAGSHLDHSGWTQAVTHTDLDNDGLQDVIVGNDFGVNAYFKNLGDGKFKDISDVIGTNKPSYTMNIGIADLNDDLLPDIYISNIVTMNKDEKYVLPSSDTTMKFNPDKLANMRVVEANDLFLSQQKDGKLQSYQLSQAVDRGYSSTGWSWDADFFDFDNDGDEDLYVLNGMNEFNLYSSENPYYTDPLKNKQMNVYIPVDTKESNVFFVNDDGRFQNASKQSGTDFLGNSRSATYLDFDQDGDLDIVVNNYHDRAVVYRNNSQLLNNHWLKIKLQGDPRQGVNRDAIGAKIIVTTDNKRRIWREIHGSIGYMSVHPKQQHFGLGDSKTVDVTVIWPNGVQQQLTGLKANQRYTIQQDASNEQVTRHQ